MKNIKKILSRITDTENVSPVTAAVIVVILIALLTCASVFVIPMAATGLVVYFLVGKINERNTVIDGCGRNRENAQNMENMKRLFIDVIKFTCNSCGDIARIRETLPYTTKGQSFTTENHISLYRFSFPSGTFDDLQFGTWDNLKSEIQHNLNIHSVMAGYGIPPYAHDKKNVVENAVRLYSLSTTGSDVIAELFLVNNEESYYLYKTLKQGDYCNEEF